MSSCLLCFKLLKLCFNSWLSAGGQKIPLNLFSSCSYVRSLLFQQVSLSQQQRVWIWRTQRWCHPDLAVVKLIKWAYDLTLHLTLQSDFPRSPHSSSSSCSWPCHPVWCSPSWGSQGRCTACRGRSGTHSWISRLCRLACLCLVLDQDVIGCKKLQNRFGNCEQPENVKY